ARPHRTRGCARRRSAPVRRTDSGSRRSPPSSASPSAACGSRRSRFREGSRRRARRRTARAAASRPGAGWKRSWRGYDSRLPRKGPGAMIERSRHDGIHELRLARPPVNALDPTLCRLLREAVDRAVADGARGIVLSGAPGVFSAGLDVPFLLQLDRTDQVRAAWDAFIEAARALAHSPVPVAAALTGQAPAGGCVLALCCDYRVMAEGDFRIGLNETQVGLVAPEGIQRLMRRV